MKFHYIVPAALLFALPLVSCEPKSDSPANASPETTAEAQETHEQLSQQMVDVILGMGEKIKAVKDDETTQAAVDYIDALPGKLEAIIDKAENLEPLSKEEATALGKKAEEKIEPAMEESFSNLMTKSEEIGQENMQKIMQSIQGVGEKMESVTERMKKLYPNGEEEDAPMPEMDQEDPPEEDGM